MIRMIQWRDSVSVSERGEEQLETLPAKSQPNHTQLYLALVLDI